MLSDVDFLIRASDLPLIIRTLRSIRAFESSAIPSAAIGKCLSGRHFLDSEIRALQVDFDLSLTWKGLVYLPGEAVLQAASRAPRQLDFLVPSPSMKHHLLLTV